MVRDNWQLFRSAIPKQTCESMIKRFLSLESTDGKIFGDNQLDKSYRESKIRWVYNDFETQQMLLRFVNEANATAFNVDIQQEMFEMQFSEYHSSYKGKYDWHHDVNWENTKNFDRKLSVVVQLSDPDNYQGGLFQFNEIETPKEEDWKNQGSVLVFPSYFTHRVTEVTEGVRYSLVSWVRGPRWR